MADEMEQEKWAVLKALFSILIAQTTLIVGLTKMQELQWNMLRVIGKEVGVDMPEPPQITDPAALDKMQRGIEELNRMFGFDGDAPPAVN